MRFNVENPMHERRLLTQFGELPSASSPNCIYSRLRWRTGARYTSWTMCPLEEVHRVTLTGLQVSKVSKKKTYMIYEKKEHADGGKEELPSELWVICKVGNNVAHTEL